MTSEILNEFIEKLITSLPMQDVIFIAKLSGKGLFHGNLKEEVRKRSSSAEAADHFLNETIEKDLKVGKDESFKKLLLVMEEFSDPLKSLAAEIRCRIAAGEMPATSVNEKPSTVTGQQLSVLYMYFLPLIKSNLATYIHV